MASPSASVSGPTRASIASRARPPGRSSRTGPSGNTATTVDSTPTAQGPPSSEAWTAKPVSSSASSKVVGLGRPERLAEGAQTGPPKALSSAWAAGWLGARTATVSSPARARSQTAASSRIGRTRVSGPGQKASASLTARSSKTAKRWAAPRPVTWAISGLKRGRPLASNRAATAEGLAASAASP